MPAVQEAGTVCYTELVATLPYANNTKGWSGWGRTEVRCTKAVTHPVS